MSVCMYHPAFKPSQPSNALWNLIVLPTIEKSTLLPSIGSFTGLILMYTGLPDCLRNSCKHQEFVVVALKAVGAQHRQNTTPTFSQPFSDS